MTNKQNLCVIEEYIDNLSPPRYNIYYIGEGLVMPEQDELGLRMVPRREYYPSDIGWKSCVWHR